MIDKELMLKTLKNIQAYKGEDAFVRCKIIINSIESGEFDLKEQTGNEKEITDTERLDFIENNYSDLVKYQDGWSLVIDYHSDLNERYDTPRQAIDVAMRGKDEAI